MKATNRPSVSTGLNQKGPIHGSRDIIMHQSLEAVDAVLHQVRQDKI